VADNDETPVVTPPPNSTPIVDPPTVVKLHDPSDVVAMVPYVVGYWPVESVVMVALIGARKRLGPTIRVDIVAAADRDDVYGQVADVLVCHRVHRVFVIGFSSDRARAEPAVASMMRAIRRRHVDVEHALWANGERWWCCHEPPRCGPPEGTSYDATSMRVSAEAVAAGLTIGADREASRRMFERDSFAAAETDAAIQRRRVEPDADKSLLSLDLVRAWTEDARPLGADEIARLAMASVDLGWRDSAWGLMDRANARAHLDLWAQVTRAVPDDLLPGPCSLAGFAAWLAGDGTVSRHAVERVLAVAPRYAMANLLEQTLDRFLDPRVWDKLGAALGQATHGVTSDS
jgi:hypothetical protein